MRKLQFVTAATLTTIAMAGSAAMTSMAAGYRVITVPAGNGTYNTSSGGNMDQLSGYLSQNGITLPKLSDKNCNTGSLNDILGGNGIVINGGNCVIGSQGSCPIGGNQNIGGNGDCNGQGNGNCNLGSDCDNGCNNGGNNNGGNNNGGNNNGGNNNGGNNNGGNNNGGNNNGGNNNGGNNNGGNNNGGVTNPGDQSEFANRVVELVNEERAKAGVAPLTVNASVADAADMRAQEITTSFSHTRPNGSNYSTALNEKGVRFTASGENIAYGQKSPEAVMETWMNSSGHRANILNANYTSIGVGCYINASGTPYWTQLFIK